MSQFSVKVIDKVQEAEDIVSLELAGLNAQPLLPFTAGAHIEVQLPGGMVRQYSLWNDPSQHHCYRIGVLRDPASRGGSVAIHDQIKVGDTLRISEPINNFALVPARRTLLFAGGIGVTPILCMARHLAQSDASFEMHYCTRSPERTAFHDRIMKSSFADKVQFHFDNGAAEQKLNLADVIAVPDSGTHIYVCGPLGFIEYVTRTAKGRGWPDGQVHLEYFTGAQQDSAQDTAFEVELDSTGETFLIPPGRSITTVLAEHGVYIPVSCEEGICGTCLTGVLKGTPDHRDLYLTDKEHAKNDQFTPCCSRSKDGKLVLDI